MARLFDGVDDSLTVDSVPDALGFNDLNEWHQALNAIEDQHLARSVAAG